jgi:hypothetical protein
VLQQRWVSKEEAVILFSHKKFDIHDILKPLYRHQKNARPIEPSPQNLVHSGFPIMVASTVTLMELSDGLLLLLLPANNSTKFPLDPSNIEIDLLYKTLLLSALRIWPLFYSIQEEPANFSTHK